MSVQDLKNTYRVIRRARRLKEGLSPLSHPETKGDAHRIFIGTLTADKLYSLSQIPTGRDTNRFTPYTAQSNPMARLDYLMKAGQAYGEEIEWDRDGGNIQGDDIDSSGRLHTTDDDPMIEGRTARRNVDLSSSYRSPKGD